jgi:hypothetical protein
MGSTSNIVGSGALVKLSYSLLSDSVYLPVAELIADPNVGGVTKAVYELTNTDIVNNRRTYAPGWGQEEPATFVVNLTEDTLEKLEAAEAAGTIAWRLSWTDPTHSSTDPMYDWSGFLTELTPVQPQDGPHTITFTVQPTGKKSLTSGT